MRIFRGKEVRYSDLQVVEAIRNGDPTFVDELYKRCRSEIQRYVCNNSGDFDEADDIIQETVITVYEKIKDGKFQLNNDTRLTTFLVAVAKNKWSNRLRAQGKLVSLPAHEEFDVEDETEELAMLEERYMELRRILEKLDEICREILRQRYWLKKKFEELEIQTIKTTDAIKMKSSRCHKQLREMHE
jgi:RNA polymerase sigma factor (sigma-70 family)